MMIQRDSLTENMILQGRYEVRKATHTTDQISLFLREM